MSFNNQISKGYFHAAYGYLPATNAEQRTSEAPIVDLETSVSGVLPVANGGTGQISIGNPGDTLCVFAPDQIYGVPSASQGNVLLSGGVGALPSYGKISFDGIVSHIEPSTVLMGQNGGLGGALPNSAGSILVTADSTTTSVITPAVSGLALVSKGLLTNPEYEKIGLTTHIDGILSVGNGGTSQSSYTDGQLLIGNSAGNTLTKATLTAGIGAFIINASGSITVAGAPQWFIQESQVSGSTSGTLTAGTNTRALNAISGTTTGDSSCSLGSSQFTLTPGIYRINGRVPGFQVGLHKAFLYNVTASANALVGSSAYATTSQQSDSIIQGELIVASTSVFSVRHEVQLTSLTNGGGTTSSMGTEIFTQISVSKIWTFP